MRDLNLVLQQINFTKFTNEFSLIDESKLVADSKGNINRLWPV